MRHLHLLFLLPLFGLSQEPITDNRDGATYAIIKLEQIYWMAENLRYEAEGSICLQDCDQIRFYDFENLANVCPDGWRLPNMAEWDLFVDAFGGVEKVRMFENNEKNYRVDFLDQFNIFDSNALNIQPYGRMEGGELDEGYHIDFWTGNESTDDRFHMHLSPYSITGHAHKHHLKKNKPEEYRLFAIRCVCEADKVERSN